MKLTRDERSSAAWLRVRDHIEERLDTLRLQNDQSQTTDETEKLRGRIAELKDLLALEREDPTIS